MGRLAVLTSALLVLAVAASELAARGEPAQSSCGAALVRYDWNRGAGGAPWVTVGPTKPRLEAWLYSYHEYLEHGRVNRSDRLKVRAGQQEKIGWFSTKWGGSRLTIVGRRLDGSGSFRQRFRAAVGAGFYPSGLVVPERGCWQLTLRTKGWQRKLVVEAIEAPAKGVCDATPVPDSRQVVLTPARSRIAGNWSWRTPEGGALLYTDGRTPEGGNTKVLWQTVGEATHLSGELTLVGTQLDGNGTFHQVFRPAGGRVGYWPSIPVVPNPGCWLFTVRIGGAPSAGGILVARVV